VTFHVLCVSCRGRARSVTGWAIGWWTGIWSSWRAGAGRTRCGRWPGWCGLSGWFGEAESATTTSPIPRASAGLTARRLRQDGLRAPPTSGGLRLLPPNPRHRNVAASLGTTRAAIVYLSSHQRRDDIRADTSVIRGYGFQRVPVYGRHEGEDYGPYVARLGLDVLVEDDIVSPRTHLLRERRRLGRDDVCQVSLQCFTRCWSPIAGGHDR
jgi:hypothetical protein